MQKHNLDFFSFEISDANKNKTQGSPCLFFGNIKKICHLSALCS